MGQFIKNFLKLLCCGAEKNNVTGRPVHIGNTTAAKVPQISDFSQVFSRVEFSTRLGYAHGVKMRNTGEHLGLIAISADNAAAITEYTDNTTVFPVGPTVFERKLEYTQNVFDHIDRDLIFDVIWIFGPSLGLLLQVGHEAGPGSGF